MPVAEGPGGRVSIPVAEGPGGRVSMPVAEGSGALTVSGCVGSDGVSVFKQFFHLHR